MAPGENKEVPLEVPLSHVRLGWRIIGRPGPIGCDTAGAAWVRVIPVLGRYTVFKQFDLDCAAGSGVTGVIPLFVYKGTLVQLIGPGGDTLVSVAAPPEPHASNYDLRAGAIIDLGTVELTVP